MQFSLLEKKDFTQFFFNHFDRVFAFNYLQFFLLSVKCVSFCGAFFRGTLKGNWHFLENNFDQWEFPDWYQKKSEVCYFMTNFRPKKAPWIWDLPKASRINQQQSKKVSMSSQIPTIPSFLLASTDVFTVY